MSKYIQKNFRITKEQNEKLKALVETVNEGLRESLGENTETLISESDFIRGLIEKAYERIDKQ